MVSTKRDLLVTLLISLLVFSSFVALGQDNSNQGQTSVLATVNGDKITQRELSQASQVQQIVMSLSRQYRSFSQFLMTSEAGQNFLSEYRKYVLDQLINQKLTAQKIDELGVTVSEEDVQEEITKIVEGNKQFSDESDLKDYLKENQNMTMDSLKSQISQGLKTEKLRERVTDKVSVSDEEVETFYNKNKQRYTDQEGNVKPLEEVRDQVRNALKSQKQNQAYNQWLEEEREKADIQKNMDQL